VRESIFKERSNIYPVITTGSCVGSFSKYYLVPNTKRRDFICNLARNSP
jgi:hypothetical protein